jgi:hypothetical protein
LSRRDPADRDGEKAARESKPIVRTAEPNGASAIGLLVCVRFIDANAASTE